MRTTDEGRQRVMYPHVRSVGCEVQVFLTDRNRAAFRDRSVWVCSVLWLAPKSVFFFLSHVA